MNKLFYIYIHTIIETNEIFYIGKGSNKRAWNTHTRNEFWKRITNKYPYKIDIVFQSYSENDVYKKEIELINLHRPKANLVSGGKGGRTGMKLSDEIKNKISKKLKGKISNRLGSKLSEDTKRKIGEKSKGRISKQRIKVMCLDNGLLFNSLTEAAKWCNGYEYHISSCCKNKYGFKTHKGYRWKYVDL